ncbi:MAG: amidohydrolase [Chloroflexi bacterium]|nr:amidohydrolase [Chloroflexota bacterium]MCL5074815.1 amidohydrolase [Chloroflexota bacterium]
MLLITNVIAVTVDARRRIIIDAAIAVDGDRIAAIGKAAEIEPRYPNVERLDGCGMLALPGLIDAHAHSPQALLRSVADDVPWRPFLEDFIWPLQGCYTPEDALISMKLCLLEMLKSGTTCFVDPLIHSRYDFDGLAQAVNDMGMRAVMAKMVMDQAGLAQQAGVINAGMLETEEQSLAEAERAIRTWHGAAGGRIQVWYGPRVPREPAVACSPDFYRRVSRLAKDHDVGITVHLAGEKDDLAFFQRGYGARPVEFARRYGLVGPNVLIAMGCWISEEEIPILAESGTKIAHCPSANMKMASGIAKVLQMRAAGVTVGLGCDSGANNNCFDMIREMKAASLLHNIATMDARALTAEDAVEMATIEGARAIGCEADLGSLEVGKQADVILVNLRQPHATPRFDPIANLVYAAHGGDVDTVIVAGRVLMRNRQVLVTDEAAILDEAEARGRALLERSGIRVAPDWPLE